MVGKQPSGRDSLGGINMKCNQCGKEIPKTNTFSVNYNGTNLKLCGKHYAQYLKYGKFLDSSQRTCFDSNEYEITNEGVWIYTFNRQNEPSGKFLIDLEDLEKVIQKKWRFWKGNYYTGNFKPVSIHRFLMSPREEEVVDHINGNRQDNRRCNLRVTTQKKNLINKELLSNNSTGIAGVWFDKERNKWSAEIRMDGIKCYLGRYSDKCDAAFVRFIAEKKLFKEFRSNRNDNNLVPLAESSKNKEKLTKYVNKRLHEKFNLSVN